MNNFKHISNLLSQRAEEVGRYLLPRGKKEGQEWCAGSIDGEAGTSLKLRINGEKTGIWADFATGDSGDLLDLWKSVRRCTLIHALHEAKQYLGINTPTFSGHTHKTFRRPITADIKAINPNSDVMKYLTEQRKLSVDTINAFKLSEKNKEVVLNYFRDNELIARKYLSLDRVISSNHPNGKKVIRVEPGCEPCLFGWQALPSNTRRIVITEGELDCMSLHQYGIPALSVPFGGGSGKKHEWIEYEFDRLSGFDEIILCFDPDDEGKAAIETLLDRLGRYRCRVLTLPYKDPNECLQQDVCRDVMHQAIETAQTFAPQELKPASAYVDKVINEFYPAEGAFAGYLTPWRFLSDKVSLRPSELSIWGGINGHGKSQLLSHLCLSMMQQSARICIASLEIKPQKLLMRMTRQAGAVSDPTNEYIRAIHEWYNDKLWLFDLVGTAKAERILEVFLYAHQRYGIDVFVIDSLMKCGIAEDDFNGQKAFIEALCDFKNQHNCHIHLVVHPRKSNDESQIPSKLDCKGSGAITDLADNCFTVWRNKAKEKVTEMKLRNLTIDSKQRATLDEPDSILRCDKQRNGEWEGSTFLWFDKLSFQYLGNPKHKPNPYITYSISE